MENFFGGVVRGGFGGFEFCIKKQPILMSCFLVWTNVVENIRPAPPFRHTMVVLVVGSLSPRRPRRSAARTSG